MNFIVVNCPGSHSMRKLNPYKMERLINNPELLKLLITGVSRANLPLRIGAARGNLGDRDPWLITSASSSISPRAMEMISLCHYVTKVGKPWKDLVL